MHSPEDPPVSPTLPSAHTTAYYDAVISAVDGQAPVASCTTDYCLAFMRIWSEVNGESGLSAVSAWAFIGTRAYTLSRTIHVWRMAVVAKTHPPRYPFASV